jgi:hypothetical protein
MEATIGQNSPLPTRNGSPIAPANDATSTRAVGSGAGSFSISPIASSAATGASPSGRWTR